MFGMLYIGRWRMHGVPRCYKPVALQYYSQGVYPLLKISGQVQLQERRTLHRYWIAMGDSGFYYPGRDEAGLGADVLTCCKLLDAMISTNVLSKYDGWLSPLLPVAQVYKFS
jgi:hypothetical protein